MSGDKDKKPADPTDLAEREAALKAREANLDARQKKLDDDAAEARKGAAVSFADTLIKDGKLMPRGKDTVVSLHQRLADSNEPFSFADGTSKPALASFEELFAGAKPIVDLSEQSADDQTTAVEIDGEDHRALAKRGNELVASGEVKDFAEGVRQAQKEASN